MNILEFYKNLIARKYKGISVFIYKGNIDRGRIERILKKVYLRGCSLEFNFFIFDFEEQFDISSVYSALQSYSFGCGKKLILIYSIENLNSKDREKLISRIEKIGNGDIFIFSREKYKIFSRLKMIKIRPMSKRPSDIASVIRSLCGERGIRLGQKNIDIIIRLYGNDIDKIDRVLERIELIGEESIKNPDLFIRTIGEGSQISFYKMTKSFLDGNIKEMKANIENLLNWGVHPIMFLAMLKKMLLKIIAVYEGYELQGDYLKDKYIDIANKLDKNKIEKLFDLFYNMEYKLRVVGIDRDVIGFYTYELLKAI